MMSDDSRILDSVFEFISPSKKGKLDRAVVSVENLIPFLRDPEAVDQSVVNAIAESKPSIEIFRSSNKLKEFLQDILDDSFIVHELPGCGTGNLQQGVRLRLSLLMRMTISYLSFPAVTSFIGIGSGSITGSSEKPLLDSLQEIVIEILSLFKLCEEFLFETGDDQIMDKRRAQLVVRLIVLRSSPMIPLVFTVSENLPFALDIMSCHILRVSAAAQEVKQAVTTITSNVRAFISQDIRGTTTNDIVANMEGQIIKYFRWLRSNYDGLAKLCRNNEVISCIDSRVRAWLKGEEYDSPEQIIRVYHQKYHTHLTHMPIPLFQLRPEDLRQSIKDISRETVMLNGVNYSGCRNCGANLDLISAIVAEFDRALALSSANACGGGLQFESSSPSPSSTSSDFTVFLAEDSRISVRRCARSSSIGNIAANADLNDLNLNDHLHAPVIASASSSVSGASETGAACVDAAVWEQQLLALLLDYTLLAGSRSAASGDAFVVLEELYGGEGLMLCPRPYRPIGGEDRSSSQEQAAGMMMLSGASVRASSSSSGGAYRSRKKSEQTTMITSNKKAAASESVCVDTTTSNDSQPTPQHIHACVNIRISEAGIKVILREQYNLFLVDAVENLAEEARPLACFECITTTLLVFKDPVAAANLSAGVRTGSGGTEGDWKKKKAYISGHYKCPELCTAAELGDKNSFDNFLSAANGVSKTPVNTQAKTTAAAEAAVTTVVMQPVGPISVSPNHQKLSLKPNDNELIAKDTPGDTSSINAPGDTLSRDYTAAAPSDDMLEWEEADEEDHKGNHHNNHHKHMEQVLQQQQEETEKTKSSLSVEKEESPAVDHDNMQRDTTEEAGKEKERMHTSIPLHDEESYSSNIADRNINTKIRPAVAVPVAVAANRRMFRSGSIVDVPMATRTLLAAANQHRNDDNVGSSRSATTATTTARAGNDTSGVEAAMKEEDNKAISVLDASHENENNHYIFYRKLMHSPNDVCRRALTIIPFK